MCDNELPKISFYTSYNPIIQSGLIPYCKECLKSHCYNSDNNFVLERFKDVLQLMDKPFLDDIWASTVETVNSGKAQNYFGTYIKNLQMPQYRNLGFGECIDKDGGVTVVSSGKKLKPAKIDDFVISDEILERWGEGYSIEEYRGFEKKYQMLKNNYIEKTSMHTEALLKYIRYSVKEEISTAKNNIKSAKEWGDLAKHAATSAKINPSQLSASDLSDGLDTIGQLARAVEQVSDIIPILPKFKERPQDKADFTLWCYINYVRDLKGMPPCEYSDIYKFYDALAKEYKVLEEKHTEAGES
jgi:hypothetical protein